MTSMDTVDGPRNEDANIGYDITNSPLVNAAMSRDQAFHDVRELLKAARWSLQRFAIEAREHQEVLAEERLEHRACQEALQFERERREEADNLVGRLFELIERAGEIADNLRVQLMQAKGTHVPSPFDCWPQWSTMGLLIELHLAKSKAKVLEQVVLSGERETGTAAELLREIAKNHQLQMRLLGLESRLKCNQWIDCHLYHACSDKETAGI
jgi:hypothetical protein